MEEYERVGKILRITEQFKNGNIRAVVEQPCPRCGGNRILPQVAHVDGGRCYQCNGTGTHTISRVVMTVQNRDKADRLKQGKRQEATATRQLQQEQVNREYEVQQAIQERQLAKNKTFTRQFIELLQLIDTRNAYEVTFARNLQETMRHKPLNLISSREKEYIADFLARKKYRRNSKNYDQVVSEILAALEEDYSI